MLPNHRVCENNEAFVFFCWDSHTLCRKWTPYQLWSEKFLEVYGSVSTSDLCLPLASIKQICENEMTKCFLWFNFRPMYCSENNSNDLQLIIDCTYYKKFKKNISWIYMSKSERIKIFQWNIPFSTKKNYRTNKTIVTFIDDFRPSDFLDFVENGPTNNAWYRKNLVVHW